MSLHLLALGHQQAQCWQQSLTDFLHYVFIVPLAINDCEQVFALLKDIIKKANGILQNIIAGLESTLTYSSLLYAFMLSKQNECRYVRSTFESPVTLTYLLADKNITAYFIIGLVI